LQGIDAMKSHLYNKETSKWLLMISWNAGIGCLKDYAKWAIHWEQSWGEVCE
jgi:hypothetical protein